MLLSAIDMGAASIGVELDTHLIGIDVAASAPRCTVHTPCGVPLDGWRDMCAPA
jgi:hypothetical protein